MKKNNYIACDPTKLNLGKHVQIEVELEGTSLKNLYLQTPLKKYKIKGQWDSISITELEQPKKFQPVLEFYSPKEPFVVDIQFDTAEEAETYAQKLADQLKPDNFNGASSKIFDQPIAPKPSPSVNEMEIPF